MGLIGVRVWLVALTVLFAGCTADSDSSAGRGHSSSSSARAAAVTGLEDCFVFRCRELAVPNWLARRVTTAVSAHRWWPH